MILDGSVAACLLHLIETCGRMALPQLQIYLQWRFRAPKPCFVRHSLARMHSVPEQHFRNGWNFGGDSVPHAMANIASRHFSAWIEFWRGTGSENDSGWIHNEYGSKKRPLGNRQIKITIDKPKIVLASPPHKPRARRRLERRHLSEDTLLRSAVCSRF